MNETGGLHDSPVTGAEQRDGAVVVSLAGELDLYNAHVVRKELLEATGAGPNG